MNRRQVKKAAARFLETGYLKHRRYEESIRGRGGNVLIIECTPVSNRLFAEIAKMARARGWSGCHWDSPFIVEEWETQNGYWNEPG